MSDGILDRRERRYRRWCWVGKFFAGIEVDLAGEEFDSEGAVLDDDFLRERTGAGGVAKWEFGGGRGLVGVLNGVGFGRVGFGFGAEIKAGMGDFFPEGEGFFGEFEALGGDVFAEVVHVEFVGPFFAVELFVVFTDLGAGGEIGQALEGEELVG